MTHLNQFSTNQSIVGSLQWLNHAAFRRFFNEGWDEKRGLTNEWELIQNYTLKLLIHVALLQNNADAAAAAKTPIQTAWAVANFYCHV